MAEAVTAAEVMAGATAVGKVVAMVAVTAAAARVVVKVAAAKAVATAGCPMIHPHSIARTPSCSQDGRSSCDSDHPAQQHNYPYHAYKPPKPTRTRRPSRNQYSA